MAGDRQADGVAAIGSTHGARGGGLADLCGDLAVAARGARRNGT